MAIDVYFYSYDNDDNKIRLEGIVDDFDSISFERSYCGIGDWSMTISGYSKNIDAIKRSNILRLNDHCCGIISDITDERDSDNFTYKIKGVELKGLTEKRIVYPKITTTLPPEELIEKLLNENMLDKDYLAAQTYYTGYDDDGETELVITGANRYIAGEVQFDDTYDDTKTVAYDNRFDTLSDAIQTLCDANDIGWYASLEDTGDGGTVKIVYHIFHGKDRTYEQSENSRFLLSYENNNLSGATLEKALHNSNSAIIAGQGEDEERHVEWRGNTYSGWNRSELYVDARDLSEEDIVDEESGATTTPTQALRQRGEEKIAEVIGNVSFDATPSAALRQQYHKSYDLGDVGTVIYYGSPINEKISTITEIYEDSEWNLEFTMGTDGATLASTVKRLQSNSTSMTYADPTSGGSYYTSGQTITLTGGTFYGYASNSTKTIIFTIPLHKSLANISSATLKTLKANIANSGGYGITSSFVDGGSSYMGSAITKTVSIYKEQNCIEINLTRSSAFTLTNNNTVSVRNNSIVLSLS